MPRKSSKSKKASKGKKNGKWQSKEKPQSPSPLLGYSGNDETFLSRQPENHKPIGLGQLVNNDSKEEYPGHASLNMRSMKEVSSNYTADSVSNVEHISKIIQGTKYRVEHFPEHTDTHEGILETSQDNDRTIKDMPERNLGDVTSVEGISDQNPDIVSPVQYISETNKDDERSIEYISESINEANASGTEEHTPDDTDMVGHTSIQENENSVENIPEDIYHDKKIEVKINPDNVTNFSENTLQKGGRKRNDVDSSGSCSDLSIYCDCETEDETLCLEEGRGVCVVSAGGGGEGRFRLQRAALVALLARPGVAERPVAVVSVAGAFRGGKSFLLDFMLRYLYAQVGARGAPDNWLGDEREPLGGFSWRNGSARDTTGLVLWSQPVPVTLPSGEHVVVLLMDTQGAFDEQSSLADCSLVFALSTLLASVQIYNVSRRLDESDLQHLQLFTDYAALGGGALQELKVLVRDWSAPYEYPYGAAGGAAYLRDKLQVKEEQPRESREIRQRLGSSFERVGCFLLPHPGLKAASDAHFRGELADLTEEFKESLQELVPLILAPENLRAKTVDGQPLRAGELAMFLEAYLDEFRDRVPSPQSVLTATAKVRWMSAAAAARAALSPRSPRRALPRAVARARLDDTMRAALAPLAALAERTAESNALASLELELDELLAQQIDANERALELAAARAREQFERAARALLQDEGLCLHPRDLAPALAAARAAARGRYLGDVDVGDDDPDLTELMIELEDRCETVERRLREMNAANNEAAAAAALAALAGALAPRPCAGVADLAAAHAAARAAALAAFRGKRSAPSPHRDEDDPYLADLQLKINDTLREHDDNNKQNNEHEVREALRSYDRAIDLNLGCWKPEDLVSKHNEEQTRALGHFYERRQGANCREADLYTARLEQGLQSRFYTLERINRNENEAAIDAAFQVFCKTMVDNSWFFKISSTELTQILNAAFDKGIEEFLKKSVPSRSLHDHADQYLRKLQQKMRNGFDKYRTRNERLMTGGDAAAMAGTACAALAVGGALAGAAGGAGWLLAAAARLLR